MPCYNSEKYLTDTLNSIKNQTIVPDEIVIINDGLTDGTQSIIESFINENKNLNVLFLSQVNLGQSVTRNKLMCMVNSEYFAFVDSDDLLHHQYVEMFHRAIAHSDIDVCINNYSKIKESHLYHKESIKSYDFVNSDFTFKTPELLKFKSEFMLGKFNLAPTTLLLRKSFIFDNLIKFREEIRYGEDGLFILGLIARAQSICKIPFELYFYRRRSNSITTNPSFMQVQKYHSELYSLFKHESIDGTKTGLFFFGYTKRFVGSLRMYAKYKNDFKGFLRLINESNLSIKDFLLHPNPKVFLIGLSILISPKVTYLIFKCLPG